MKTMQRLCGERWEITAKNGDHFATERGREYTTTANVKDGKVMVFSNYWVNVPVDVFYEQDSLEAALAATEQESE